MTKAIEWMMKDRRLRYAAAFLIPFLVLVSMTIIPVMTSILGTEIVIKTIPYDPRDIFRGDYVVLNYEINVIKNEFISEEIKELGDPEDEYSYYDELKTKDIYVILKEVDGVHVIESAVLKKPKKGIYLKGKYDYTVGSWDQKTSKRITEGIRVDYTLDKFFVSENTGKDLEELSRKGELYAKIKIYRGYSLLVDVFEKLE